MLTGPFRGGQLRNPCSVLGRSATIADANDHWLLWFGCHPIINFDHGFKIYFEVYVFLIMLHTNLLRLFDILEFVNKKLPAQSFRKSPAAGQKFELQADFYILNTSFPFIEDLPNYVANITRK